MLCPVAIGSDAPGAQYHVEQIPRRAHRIASGHTPVLRCTILATPEFHSQFLISRS
jgi:hypothetical protein